MIGQPDHGLQWLRLFDNAVFVGADRDRCSQTSGGTVSWYLADHLGTVSDLINNSGAIIDHVDFSAFGTVLDESSPTNGDRMIGFAALERDTVTGLNLAVEREENPGTGRWDSQDPLGFGGGEDNLYGYVANSPTDCEDTSGLDARALPAAPTMDPAAFLGPGDLVILTGNFAQGNENQGAFVPQLAEFVLASKGRPAKGSPAPGGGFVVSPTQPTTPEELADAINQAVKDNGGRPFRRIIVISHAGGEINAPALNPSKKPGQPDRLFFCEKEESPARAGRLKPRRLRPALQRALRNNGILVLGSCGHYPSRGASQAEWVANLQGWASTYGVPTYAPPGNVQNNVGRGVIDEATGGPVPFIGYGPDGKPLPFSRLPPP